MFGLSPGTASKDYLVCTKNSVDGVIRHGITAVFGRQTDKIDTPA